MNTMTDTHAYCNENASIRVFIRTYGCQMNVLDSRIMRGLLIDNGFSCVDNEEDADVFLFNTCSVRDLSERKVLGKLGMLTHTRKRRPEIVLGICGCMAQLAGERIIEKNPHVDFVCGTRARNSLPSLVKYAVLNRLNSAVKTKHNQEHLLRMHRACSAENTPLALCPAYSHSRVVIDDTGSVNERCAIRPHPWSAFVEIVRGCSNFCTYCVVPHARGPEVSRPSHDILDEILTLANAGCKEITLLGQNVNSYGKDTPLECSFPELLTRVAKINGIERLRFLTSNPQDVSPALIEVMATTPKICRHIHFPLQSGSDTILKKMNRKYSLSEYLDLVNSLRKAMPDIAFSSDFIVGFPSESDDDFAATRNAMEKVRYTSSFLFKYSPRPGTAAAEKMSDNVPQNVKAARHAELLALQNSHTKEHHAAAKGCVLRVLPDGTSKRNSEMLQGRSERYFNVVFPGEKNDIGHIIDVQITEYTPLTLYGKKVPKKEPGHEIT
jgi:tRNA-2-methylthio-N6-dimethylallyladenosine synthase